MKNFLFTTFLSLGFFGSIFLVPNSVEGVYTGREPDINPIPVNIDRSMAQGYQTAWERAISDWNSAQSSITFTSTSEPSGNLASAQSYSGEPRLRGRVHYESGTGDSTPFRTYLNTLNDDITSSANVRRSTANHEFGHVLGLAHYGPDSIMNTGRNAFTLTTPTTRDGNNVDALN